MNFKKYFNEDKFKIIYYNNLLNVINYKELILLSEDKIVLKNEDFIIIKGSNLSILKLLDNEILINGFVNNIELR